MGYLWIAIGFNYYVLLLYVKYIPGTIYLNSYMLSIAEVSGVILSLFFYKCFKVQRTFLLGFGTSLAGGLLILVMG